GSGQVPASSLSKLATLGALHGHQVEVSASGSQARKALEHVLALARRGFDEPTGAATGYGTGTATGTGYGAATGIGAATGTATGTTPAPVADGRPGGAGLAASPGIGIGLVWTLRAPPIEVPDAHTEDPAAEWRRLSEALAAARREVQRVRARTARQSGE